MPYVNTTAAPAVVFTAPTGAGVYPTCAIKNESSQTLFVGMSACTPKTGVPLAPGTRIQMGVVSGNLYACSNWSAGTAAATASASAATVGTTSWTVASGGMANIPVGTSFVIGVGTGAEVLTVATSASTTTITTGTGSLFAHAPSEVLSSVVTIPGTLRVERGTTLPPVGRVVLPG